MEADGDFNGSRTSSGFQVEATAAAGPEDRVAASVVGLEGATVFQAAGEMLEGAAPPGIGKRVDRRP